MAPRQAKALSSDGALRHAVILAHPERRSFNAAIATAYGDTVRAQGQEVVLRDLYRMRFNPVLKAFEQPGSPRFRTAPDVATELGLLAGCAVFTIIHPIWFGMPPAIMKGYIDRVIGSGVTVRAVQEGHGQSLFSAARLLTITTSGIDKAWLDDKGQTGALRDLSSRYLFQAFGMRSAETLHLGGISPDWDEAAAEHALDQVRARALKICSLLATESGGTAVASIGDGS